MLLINQMAFPPQLILPHISHSSSAQGLSKIRHVDLQFCPLVTNAVNGHCFHVALMSLESCLQGTFSSSPTGQTFSGFQLLHTACCGLYSRGKDGLLWVNSFLDYKCLYFIPCNLNSLYTQYDVCRGRSFGRDRS